MAAKSKKSTAKKISSTKTATTVTRIKADESGPSPKKIALALTTDDQTAKQTSRVSSKTALKPLRAITGYFQGAWYELLQVRWPNRKATWSLTAAVLIFSAFFTLLIVLLDALFKYLFELILK